MGLKPSSYNFIVELAYDQADFPPTNLDAFFVVSRDYLTLCQANIELEQEHCDVGSCFVRYKFATKNVHEIVLTLQSSCHMFWKGVACRQSCLYGKATKRPWRGKTTKRRVSDVLPTTPLGQFASVDQLVSPTPGLIAQLAGFLTAKRYKNSTVFVDNYSNLLVFRMVAKDCHSRWDGGGQASFRNLLCITRCPSHYDTVQFSSVDGL